jgi:hypothetical protein
MPASALRSFQLVGAQKVDVTTQTAMIYGITINCESDGQHIEIRDKGTPPKKLIGSYALKVEPLPADPIWMVNPHIYEWSNGKMMDGGITIETTGTTGTASVWIDYQTAPLGSS